MTTDERPTERTTKRITGETQIRVTDPFDLDDVFLRTVEESNLMHAEYAEDGETIERFEIDPRILRSVMFLYSSQERTRHDWR